MKTYKEFINEVQPLPTTRPRKKTIKKAFKNGQEVTVNKKGDKLDGKTVKIIRSKDNGVGDMYSVEVNGSLISQKFNKSELVS